MPVFCRGGSCIEPNYLLRLQHGTNFLCERLGLFFRKIQQRQAGKNRADGFNRFALPAQQFVQLPCVSSDDVCAWKFFAEQPRHFRVVFDGDEFFLAQTTLDERLRNRAGSRSEFKDETFGIRWKPARHGCREFSGAGDDRTHPLRIGKPLLQKQPRVVQRRYEFFWPCDLRDNLNSS